MSRHPRPRERRNNAFLPGSGLRVPLPVRDPARGGEGPEQPSRSIVVQVPRRAPAGAALLHSGSDPCHPDSRVPAGARRPGRRDRPDVAGGFRSGRISPPCSGCWSASSGGAPSGRAGHDGDGGACLRTRSVLRHSGVLEVPLPEFEQVLSSEPAQGVLGLRRGDVEDAVSRAPGRPGPSAAFRIRELCAHDENSTTKRLGRGSRFSD